VQVLPNVGLCPRNYTVSHPSGLWSQEYVVSKIIICLEVSGILELSAFHGWPRLD